MKESKYPLVLLFTLAFSFCLKAQTLIEDLSHSGELKRLTNIQDNTLFFQDIFQVDQFIPSHFMPYETQIVKTLLTPKEIHPFTKILEYLNQNKVQYDFFKTSFQSGGETFLHLEILPTGQSSLNQLVKHYQQLYPDLRFFNGPKNVKYGSLASYDPSINVIFLSEEAFAKMDTYSLEFALNHEVHGHVFLNHLFLSHISHPFLGFITAFIGNVIPLYELTGTSYSDYFSLEEIWAQDLDMSYLCYKIKDLISLDSLPTSKSQLKLLKKDFSFTLKKQKGLIYAAEMAIQRARAQNTIKHWESSYPLSLSRQRYFQVDMNLDSRNGDYISGDNESFVVSLLLLNQKQFSTTILDDQIKYLFKNLEIMKIRMNLYEQLWDYYSFLISEE